MTPSELRDYIGNTSNLSALSRVVKSRNSDLYHEIINAWPHADQYVNFVEAARHYFSPEPILCPYGHRMKFNGYRHGYTCKKTCPLTAQKHKVSMIRNHGVEHAMQSANIKDKFKSTMINRYGHDTLYAAFFDQRKNTNLDRYGVEHPLQSKDIYEETVSSYQSNTGYATPFHKFNSTEHRSEYKKKARATYKANNPEKYDYPLIYDTLQNNSIAKTSELLGLWPSHIKNVIVSQGWDDLLPKKSSYEGVIARFLDSIGISYITNSRSIIAPYELDFYIAEHNLAIEINGLRWHSESYGGKDKTYHLNKTTMCAEAGIKLIHIFEDELNNRFDTVTSILKTHLSIPKETLHGRKCAIVELDTITAREFCELHHLQGYAASTYRFGLYHHDDLVSLMTFKRDGDGYELSRYCVHPDYQINGGAQKLFTAFNRKFRNPVVYTYSDNRYFTGRLYQSLGFTYSHDTPPNYWYFTDSSKRYHRLGFTKQKLVKMGFDSSLPEWNIMQSIGYDRIWDCGSKKWIRSKI